MADLTVKNPAGKDAGSVSLDDAVFGIEPNGPVMHQVVTAQLAARRRGTHSTKTRAEVRGGGAKPWKQKGTGRARAGSSRSPIWVGGGKAHGPKPRDYSQKTPKKMVRLALRSALSDRAAEGNVIVVDGWNFDAPKTKDAAAALDALGADGKILVVLNRDDDNAWKSFRNIERVHVLAADQLNTFDVLVADKVIFTTDTLPTAAADAVAAEKKAAKAAAAGEAAAAAAAKIPTADAVPADAAPADESGADSTTEDADADGTVNADDDTPYGAGSAHAGEDGSAPDDSYVIKGNADSMLYHPESSPFFGRTVAEVWFQTAEQAEAAGFQLPPSMREASSEEEE